MEEKFIIIRIIGILSHVKPNQIFLINTEGFDKTNLIIVLNFS